MVDIRDTVDRNEADGFLLVAFPGVTRLLEHFPCYWDSRRALAVAFSLEKTPKELVVPHYTHREKALVDYIESIRKRNLFWIESWTKPYIEARLRANPSVASRFPEIVTMNGHPDSHA